MLKLSFNDEELKLLMAVIHFTPRQKRILAYRRNEETRVKMADLEHTSVPTIDREIKDIAIKIQQAYDRNLIVF